MKNCIITAIYKLDEYISNTGDITLSRNMMLEHYITGLRSILSLGYNTYVFYNEEYTAVNVENMCKKHIEDFDKFKDNVHFLPYNLKTQYYNYNSINKYALNEVNKEPNKLVCWNPGFAIGKFNFFDSLFDKGYDNVIWIDAGLSDQSYIPIENGGTSHAHLHQDYKFYYPNNENAIFKPEFGNRLFEILDKHKLFICGINSITNELRDFCEKNIPYYTKLPIFSMTGAIIGINKLKYTNLYSKIQQTVNHFIQNSTYVFTEIDILTYINVIEDIPKLSWNNFVPDINYNGSLAQFFNSLIYKNEQIRSNNKYI